MQQVCIRRWRAIKPTFSYHRTRALINTENGLMPGASCVPRSTIPGQTYWFSADMNQLLPGCRKTVLAVASFVSRSGTRSPIG